MSNLLHHSLCPKAKQETLTGFIKKMSNKQTSISLHKDSETSDSCDEINRDNTDSKDFKPKKEIMNTFSAKLMKATSPNKTKTLNNDNVENKRDLFSSSCQYVCPVCGKDIHCRGVQEMNFHVDKCLVHDETKNNREHQSVLPRSPPSTSKESTGSTEELQPKSKNSAEVVSPSNLSVGIGVADGSVDTTTVYICPICNLKKDCSSLDEFNYHVDACLSRGTIKEILQEQKVSTLEIANTSKKRKLKIVDKTSEQAPKKKKSENSNSNVQTKSIDSFFKT